MTDEEQVKLSVQIADLRMQHGDNPDKPYARTVIVSGQVFAELFRRIELLKTWRVQEFLEEREEESRLI